MELCEQTIFHCQRGPGTFVPQNRSTHASTNTHTHEWRNNSRRSFARENGEYLVFEKIFYKIFKKLRTNYLRSNQIRANYRDAVVQQETDNSLAVIVLISIH